MVFLKKQHIKTKNNSFYTKLLVLLCLFFIGLNTHAHADQKNNENGAVIYAYHRIDELGFPATNIQFEQFKSHIDEILNGNYNVLPLSKVVEALKNKSELPNKAVVITFEGGHRSILKKAVPLLRKHKLPFTVFFSVDQADWQSTSYLGWTELEELSELDYVDLGVHTATYSHLLDYDDRQMRMQINRAKTRFREMLDEEPQFFAYPFGEFSLKAKNLVEEYGFSAALGQQSSVANEASDIFALPRFAMTENYGGLERFKLTANALPIKIKEFQPTDFHIDSSDDNPPSIGFTFAEDYDGAKSLSCFSNSEGDLKLDHFGKRIEIRLSEPLSEGRARINCTMPAYFDETGNQRWRWFGLLFTVESSAHNSFKNNDENASDDTDFVIRDTSNDE
ncbi:MAG: polysaccharide deacetylase [Rickettsiales bacterium]|nr:polysaccharide deacetylase [Rickettsiales bacterium]